jgi:hypothetical protein
MLDNGALLLDSGRDVQGKIITVTGKPFHREGSTGVADSVQDVEGANLIRPATYHLVNGRGLAKKDNLVWTQWHDTNAERDTIIDAKGILGKKGAIYVVEFQNGGMWIGDHQRVRNAVRYENLVRYTLPLEPKEVNILLDAIKQGDTKVLKKKGWIATDNAYVFGSAEEFMEESDRADFLRNNPAYVVLRTQKKAQGDLKGYHPIDQQRDNVSLIIPSGGKKPLGKMLDKAASFDWKKFGSYNNDGYKNYNSGRVASGRVALLSILNCGVYCSDSLNGYGGGGGRSVGVAPEALVARENIVEPLDQIVAESEVNRIP